MPTLKEGINIGLPYIQANLSFLTRKDHTVAEMARFSMKELEANQANVSVNVHLCVPSSRPVENRTSISSFLQVNPRLAVDLLQHGAHQQAHNLPWLSKDDIQRRVVRHT